MTEPRDTLLEREKMVLVVIDIQDRLSAVMERREQVVTVAGRLVRTAAKLH